MTGFLASVSSVDEARLVRSLGADVIDLKDPARGALGALDEDSVRAIASLPDKNTMLSATIGDLPVYAAELETAITGMHACGVDIVKVGVFDRNISPFMLSVLDRLTARGISIVLVFFAELYPPDIDFQRLRRGGVTGVMLDTCEKADGNLRDKLDDGTLTEFVRKAATGSTDDRPCGFAHPRGYPALAAYQPGLPGIPRRLVQTASAYFPDRRRKSRRHQEANPPRAAICYNVRLSKRFVTGNNHGKVAQRNERCHLRGGRD